MSARCFQGPKLRRKRGFALILVLGILILVTLLVVGFLGHALTQVKSVTSYRAQTDSLLLSDVAVDLVKAQIDDATSQPASIWASQPGAIRTFKNDGSDTSYGTTYKLYSSSSLTSIAPATDIPNDLPGTSASTASDWNSNPLWTDLNAPVQKSDGTYAYPILDAYNDLLSGALDLPGEKFTGASAPPKSFTITSTNPANVVGAALSTTNNYPVPMPVRWLYILKQGQIIAPDLTSTSPTATFSNTPTSSQPTVANPIVGRVAFWTDDDTCRVNINTAGVSGTSAAPGTGSTDIDTFWDTPHFTASDEYLLGLYQPANKEYQRYPGHPAMTTLALALPEFTDTSGNVTLANMQNVLSLTPRYGNGGSAGGTVLSNTSPGITLDANRLYASVNELLFNPPGVPSPTRTVNSMGLTRQQLETAKFFLTAHSRAPELNLFGLPRVSIWPVSSSTGTSYRTATDNLLAFCSTTPGVTPTPYYFVRSPYNVAASPSTGSNSCISDVNLPQNVNLLTYLDNLTSLPVPGVPGYTSGNSTATFGGTTGSPIKYGQLGMRQILTEMFDYIRITNSRDPGLDPTSGGVSGGIPYAAATAWDNTDTNPSSGSGQILPTQYATWGTYGFGRFQGRVVEASIIFIGAGQGPAVGSPQTWTSATPVPANQAGIGSGVFYSSLTSGNPNPNNPCSAVPPASANFTPPPGQTAVMALLLLNFFDPALGYARTSSYVATVTSGLTGITVAPSSGNTVPLSQQLFVNDGGERLSTQTALVTGYSQYEGANPGSLGSLMDFRIMMGGRTIGPSNTQYSTYSDIINMPTGGTFVFNPTGASFTVSICANGAATVGGTTTVPLVHTYTFNFPKATLQVPTLSVRPLFGSVVGRETSLLTTGSVGGKPYDRFDDVRATDSDTSGYYDHLIDFKNDTLISMIPTAAYGDYRMLCAPTTPAAAFTSLYNYTPPPPPASQVAPAITLGASGSPRLAYGFMYPSGQTFTGSVRGNLVLNIPSTSYNITDTSKGPSGYGSPPIVPYTVQYPAAGGGAATTSPLTPPPDFDNGFGELPDGPFINKPDEGAVYTTGNGGRVYYDNADANVDTTTSPSFFFSPQRQVPSPVMFGSLPTGAPVNGSTPAPWQTLLFQPGVTGHAGLTPPKDEYLLDLFWMPQALPYPVSEPFSTAGKVNLNYQILPFTYIDRSTAIQSVLASEKVARVGKGVFGTVFPFTYKNDSAGATTGMNNLPARYPLNLSETNGTLRQFVAKWNPPVGTTNPWTVFKSAAEICDVYLVPSIETTWTTDALAQTAWYDNSSASKYSLVGDNTREKPYADLYSRVTTKSNVFTVYYRVQTLKNPSATAASWTEGTGAITGEYRGSTTIERYIDPNSTAVPAYASSTYNSPSLLAAAPSLDSPTYYKWRVVENDRFSP